MKISPDHFGDAAEMVGMKFFFFQKKMIEIISKNIKTIAAETDPKMRENLARIVRNQIENLRKELLKTLDERDTHGAVAKLLGVRTEAPKDFNISEKQ